MHCNRNLDIFLAFTTATHLEHYISLLHSKPYPYTHIFVQLLASMKEASRYSKWRPSQKTTAGHNAEISGSLRSQTTGYIYITASVSLAQGMLKKMGQKEL